MWGYLAFLTPTFAVYVHYDISTLITLSEDLSTTISAYHEYIALFFIIYTPRLEKF